MDDWGIFHMKMDVGGVGGVDSQRWVLFHVEVEGGLVLEKLILFHTNVEETGGGIALAVCSISHKCGETFGGRAWTFGHQKRVVSSEQIRERGG